MKRYLLILCATAGLYACSQPAAETTDKARFVRAELHNPSSRYVVVVSHRGDWRNWPENSIPAIESVIGMGRVCAHCWQCKKPAELLMPSCSVTLQTRSAP